MTDSVTWKVPMSLYHHRDHGHDLFKVTDAADRADTQRLTDIVSGKIVLVRGHDGVFFCSDFCGCKHRKGPDAKRIYYPGVGEGNG